MRAVLLGLVLGLAGCGDGGKPPWVAEKEQPKAEKVEQGPTEPPIKAPAGKVWNDFEENQFAAETTYKGKWVEMLGTVSKIESRDGVPVVGFGVVIAVGMDPHEYARLTPQEKKWFNEGYPPNVVVVMDRESGPDVAKLKKDQIVSVVAKCVGASKSPDVWHGFVVEFSGGKVVPAAK
jgi:hypothetical protein